MMQRLVFSFALLIGVFFCQAQTFIVPVQDSVEIRVDHWGVPHIYARTDVDLFFAQGFNAARDRLFQFEIWRRQATGTVAEILGPAELKRDIGTRLFMYRGDLEEELAHYHPQGVAIIQSFVAGVNSYIRWVRAHPESLPPMFKWLDILPEFWTPEVVISRHQGLLGNIEQELDIGRMVHLVGEEKVRELMWFHPNRPVLDLDSMISGAHLMNDILELYDAYRKPVSFDKDGMGWISGETVETEERLYGNLHTLGSNNWVVDGNHTQSGFPMMANDPHRTLAVPSLRYIAHLEGPGWSVVGGGEPEIPGISIGHNDYGAWGLTVFRTDAEDLMVYRLNEQDPDQYWYQDHWETVKIIWDTIMVKGKTPEVVALKYTVHGPLVYQDQEELFGYAVRCGWLEPGGSPYLASLRMNQSIDFESFREACNYSHIPGENMVWADRAGNIGWQAVGIAPIRTHFSGLVPIPGDGRYEWNGYLEIKKKPNKYNPASGYIITANENVTASDYPFPEALGYTWSDPVRGDRIAEVMADGQKMSPMDMAALQNDYLSLPARTLVPMLLRLKHPDPQIDSALNYLSKWDCKLTPDAIAATIYNEWERVLLREIRQVKVPEKIRAIMPGIQYKRLMDWLVFPDGSFGEDPVSGRDSFMLHCLVIALRQLHDRLGTEMSDWQYGQNQYKHVLFSHDLASRATSDQVSLNVGPAPRGGNGSTVGSTGSSLRQSTGATFKVIVDTEDWDRCLAINAPGQSGDPRSEHYRNLFEMWSVNDYFPLFFSRAKVEEVTDYVVWLVPE